MSCYLYLARLGEMFLAIQLTFMFHYKFKGKKQFVPWMLETVIFLNFS